MDENEIDIKRLEKKIQKISYMLAVVSWIVAALSVFIAFLIYKGRLI